MHKSVLAKARPLLLAAITPLAIPAQGPTFAGKWSTSFGPMQLTVKGGKVTGHYAFGETKVTGTIERTLERTLEGDTLRLKYAGGTATFRLWKDGDTFTGEFTSSKGPTGTWGAYRIRPKVAPASPGEITAGQSKSWLNYHLRVPKRFDKKKRYPAIAFLHGSNMSSRAYVNTIAAKWPDLAKDYILVGFDGERMNGSSKPGRKAFNFTYVNFSGHKKGPAWVHRQSPALVSEALDELKGQFGIERWYLGGHSQGGFLTYAVFMYYPDSVAGVFPMSCNLLTQCDPEHFTDAKHRAKQRRVAVAVIHGENDRVVGFQGGQWCHRAMVDGGFPAVKFFTHRTAGHMFALLPVERAVRWLEVLTSEDPTTLISFADEQLEAGEHRDAAAALVRVRGIGVPADMRYNVASLAKKLDREAKGEATRLLQAIRANKNGGWVDDFLEFREEFGFTHIAKDVMAAYAELREQHAKPATALFYAARRLRDEGEREEKYEEILEKYYASKWYAHVKAMLDN